MANSVQEPLAYGDTASRGCAGSFGARLFSGASAGEAGGSPGKAGCEAGQSYHVCSQSMEQGATCLPRPPMGSHRVTSMQLGQDEAPALPPGLSLAELPSTPRATPPPGLAYPRGHWTLGATGFHHWTHHRLPPRTCIAHGAHFGVFFFSHNIIV